MSAELEQSTDWLNLAPVSDSPIAVRPDVPETIAARDAKLVASYAALSPKQRMVLQSLQDNYFNVRTALKVLAHTGDAVDKSTYHKWCRTDSDFVYALQAFKAYARESLDPERTILRIAEIAEEALVPKDVYFKGAPTGEKRKDFGAALKATELQMRHKKLMGEADTDKGGFGGRNITLAVQVVMPGGEVKDVTRKGIVIDVPVIEVAP